MSICSPGTCQWCGCHFVKPTDVMYHRCAAMQRALGLGREVRCRCGAWRLDDEPCGWCDIRIGVREALDAIDKYAADELGLDHSLHALVEHYRRALGVDDK